MPNKRPQPPPLQRAPAPAAVARPVPAPAAAASRPPPQRRDRSCFLLPAAIGPQAHPAGHLLSLCCQQGLCSGAVTAASRAAAGALLPSAAAAAAGKPSDPTAPVPMHMKHACKLQWQTANKWLHTWYTQQHRTSAACASLQQLPRCSAGSSLRTGAEAATRGTLPKKSVTRTLLGCCGKCRALHTSVESRSLLLQCSGPSGFGCR